MAVARRTGGLFGVRESGAFLSLRTPMRHSISLSPNSRFGFSRTTETIFPSAMPTLSRARFCNSGKRCQSTSEMLKISVGSLPGKPSRGTSKVVVWMPSNPAVKRVTGGAPGAAGERGLELDRLGFHFHIPDPPLILDGVADLLDQLVEIRAAGTQIEVLETQCLAQVGQGDLPRKIGIDLRLLPLAFDP